MYHVVTNAVHRMLLILWLYTIDKTWKCLGCNPYAWSFQYTVPIIPASWYITHNTRKIHDVSGSFWTTADESSPRSRTHSLFRCSTIARIMSHYLRENLLHILRISLSLSLSLSIKKCFFLMDRPRGIVFMDLSFDQHACLLYSANC